MSVAEVSNILKKFETIHLNEMDEVQLMNRTDTKFVFSIDQLNTFLPEMIKDYKVLSIEGDLMSGYHSVYYDNSDLQMYKNHHRQMVDRFKVRFREYMNTGISFLEVKHKVKGRTEKFRIPTDGDPKEMSDEEREFVRSQGVEHKQLHPTLVNDFKRITFVGKRTKERLTIDIDLKFEWDDEKRSMHELVIAELKQEKRDRNSPFYALMKRHMIRPFRISKYCIGVISTRERSKVKYNRFKKKLLKIDKINKYAA